MKSTEPPVDEEPEATGINRRKTLIAAAIMFGVGFIVFGVIFPQLVDWREVVEVLRAVDGWELAVIGVLAVTRFLPSGRVYSVVVPGLSLVQGTKVWVSTTAMASTVPGFDIPLRFAMYRTYNVPLERGVSGMFLGGLVEMSTNFTVAILGVAVGALAIADLGLIAVAGIAALVMAIAAVIVLFLLRSDRWAAWVGDRVEKLVLWGSDKLGRQAPVDVVERVMAVRTRTRDILAVRSPSAYLAAVLARAMIFTMLMVALRATGVGSSVLSWQQILLSHGLVIIVTMVPLVPGAVGIAEVVYAGSLIGMTGSEHATVIMAGVILYRLAFWLTPIVIGWIIILAWQKSSGAQLLGGGSATRGAVTSE